MATRDVISPVDPAVVQDGQFVRLDGLNLSNPNQTSADEAAAFARATAGARRTDRLAGWVGAGSSRVRHGARSLVARADGGRAGAARGVVPALGGGGAARGPAPRRGAPAPAEGAAPALREPPAPAAE